MPESIPWQLYLFCAFQFWGFVWTMPWIRDPCQSFGSRDCTSLEMAAFANNSIMILSLGVYFLILTLRNRDKPEKLQRLAYFAIYCTIANLASLLMIGASSVTGLMNTTEHVLYVMVTLILFFVLASMVSTDTPMVATTPFLEGLGFNLKGLFVLLAIVCISWIFAGSDFIPITSVFDDTKTNMTEVAKMCFNYFNVLFLQILLVCLYAIAYIDDDKDRAILAMAFSTTFILNALVTWEWRKIQVTGFLSSVLFHDIILLFLTLGAIARYQVDRRRNNNYETLISNA